MSVAVTVLLVEDSADDAELVVRELRRAGFDPDWTRVETEPDFLKALKAPPQLIISDYSLPQFNGLRAVQLLRAKHPDIPFILISGTVGEEIAVTAMKHGATDYLLKDRIARLGSAVRQALEQRRLREERRQAELIQAELSHRNESFVRALGEIVYDHDVTSHQINWAGDLVKCIGWSAIELGTDARNWAERVHPDDLARVNAQLETLSIEPLFVSEYRFRHKAGHYIWIFDRGVISRNPHGRITRVVGIMWDITARKRAEEHLRENEERFRQLAENIQEVFWMTNLGKNEMIYISPGYEKIWGRPCSELYQSGRLWLEAIHPDDRDRITAAIKTKQSLGTYDEEYRILRPDGSLPETFRRELLEIGAWLKTNGEAIYGTRPFRVYGEGPFQKPKSKSHFNDSEYNFVAQDIRFTQSKDGKTVYAIALGAPSEPLRIKALGSLAFTFSTLACAAIADLVGMAVAHELKISQALTVVASVGLVSQTLQLALSRLRNVRSGNNPATSASSAKSRTRALRPSQGPLKLASLK